MKIALLGNKRAGKTTLAQHLERTTLVRRLHVKTVLGEMITPILLRVGIPLDQVTEYIFGDRIEEPLPPPLHDRTTRHLLQAAGGGFLRDLKVEGLPHLLLQPDEHVPALNESVRRPEESDWLRANGWTVVRVVRPSTGGPTHEHATETDLSGVAVDAELVNDCHLDQFLARGSALAQSLGLRVVRRDRALLVLNGRPGCGKDTITEALRRRCAELNVRFHFMSSIDPVRQMLMHAGVDVSAKTAADRDLLAAVKRALAAHQQWPTRWVLGAHDEVTDGNARHLFVTHVREPDEIERLTAHHAIACWVRRPGLAPSDATNPGDHGSPDDYAYDLLWHNDGTLLDLERRSHQWVQDAFCTRTERRR